MEVRYVVCCCLKSPWGCQVKINLSICLSITPFSNFISSCFLGFQGDRIGSSMIKKKKKVQRSHSFLSLQAEKPQQRWWRLSRGLPWRSQLLMRGYRGSTGKAAGWRVEHLRQCRKHEGGGGVTEQRCPLAFHTQSPRGCIYIRLSPNLSVCTNYLLLHLAAAT